jgi:hypothetical protein
MTLSAVEIQDLVALNAPALCLDTCTILDVIRDITRESTRVSDVNAGLALLEACETKTRLAVLLADQVRIELTAHIIDVEKEGKTALEKFTSQVRRIDEIAAAFGAQGRTQVSHLDDHVVRARSVFERWIASTRVIPHDDRTTARAFARVNGPRTPAKRGKESMKDCVIIEAYLELAGQLRNAGHQAPIVFASSNTKEYYAAGSSQLAVDIAADFQTVRMEYAPTFGAARHLLKL